MSLDSLDLFSFLIGIHLVSLGLSNTIWQSFSSNEACIPPHFFLIETILSQIQAKVGI